MKSKYLLLAAALLLLLSACAPPAPAVAPLAEAQNAADEAAEQPTATDPPPTATPLPTPPPTATATTEPSPTPEENRIEFESGADSAQVTGELDADGAVEYVLLADADQQMMVTLDTQGDEVTLAIYGAEDGATILRPEAEARSWEGQLPLTQDYLIRIVAGDEAISYTLDVLIPPSDELTDEELYSQGCPFTALQAIDVYFDPVVDPDLYFGRMEAGEQHTARVVTSDGWLGFDPGVAQAGNTGIDRMRWFDPKLYSSSEQLINFDAPCDNLPVYTP